MYPIDILFFTNKMFNNFVTKKNHIY